MSASICWKPASEITASIRVGAPSSFMETMEKAHMRLPCTLMEQHLPVLRGMAAVYGRNSTDNPNPYQQIVDLLEKHDAIELWATY